MSEIHLTCLYRLLPTQSNSLFCSLWGEPPPPKPRKPQTRTHCSFQLPRYVYISKFKTLSFTACLLELYAASLFSSHLYLCNPEAMPWIYIPVRGEPSHASNDCLLHVYLAYSTGKKELTAFPAPGSDPTCSTDFSPKVVPWFQLG